MMDGLASDVVIWERAEPGTCPDIEFNNSHHISIRTLDQGLAVGRQRVLPLGVRSRERYRGKWRR